MSLAELRSQLREMRKSAPALPISKMKKHEVVMELEGHKKKPVAEVKEEVCEVEVPVVKKIAPPKEKKPVEKKVVEKKEEVKEKKAPAPKKVKAEEPVKVEKVSIKSAPRKKKD